jgi:hypothetical protein
MGGNFGQLTRQLEVTDEFCLTEREFCPTPGAKLGQFRPTAPSQPTTSKRLARARWGEIREPDHNRTRSRKRKKREAAARANRGQAASVCLAID